MDRIYRDRDISLSAFDISSNPNINVIADAHNMIASEFFAAVIIQAVLKQVPRPDEMV